MYDIITIGGAAIDIFMRSKNFQAAHACKDTSDKPLLCLGYDTKIMVEDVHFSCGGGGANTAVSFSRLGQRTAFFGKIGKDELGERVVNKLKKAKVDTRLIKVSRVHKTGFSVALHSYAPARTLLLFRGANDEISESDFSASELKRTKWIFLSHLSGKADCIFDNFTRLIKKYKISLAWNPGSTQLAKGIRYLSPLLKQTDILFLNKGEAEQLVAKDKSQKDFSCLFKKLAELGPKIIVITHGKNGSRACLQGKIYLQEIYEAGEVKDTTGAGDAFASGFTAGYIETGSIVKALAWGARQSGAVVTEYGAQNGLLKKSEFIKK